MGAKITVANNTKTPIGLQVFTTGRGFLVKSGIINNNSREAFEGLERVWYEVVVLDVNNKEVAKLTVFCGGQRNGFNPNLVVIESGGIYAIKQLNKELDEPVQPTHQ